LLSRPVGEEYQVLKKGREYHEGKNITWDKTEGEEI